MKFKHIVAIFLLAITFSAFVNPKKATKTFVSNFENVLGTSLELKFKAANQTDADVAENIALNEIDRLDNILSAYKKTSEFCNSLKTTKALQMAL